MIYSVTDFGAQPDGSLCTKQIQQAINACRETGGTVEIPPGVFYSGTLQLYSNITLRLNSNSVLKGSCEMKDYPSIGYVHNEMGEVRCLLYAMDCENITIEGEGTIDFNGDAFFDYTKPRSKAIQVEKLNMEQRTQFEADYEERPTQMAFFRKCRNIQVRNVMLKNAACWGLVFSTCSEVKIRGLSIRFNRQVPNADGIHLSACNRVIITDCDIVSGDDCIAVTSIDDWQFESRNILISNCLLSSSSAGIRIGYWRSVVRNVQIQNCTIYESNRGLCIMACESGLVENVQANGLIVETKSLAGGWWGAGEAIYICTLSHKVTIQPEVLFCEGKLSESVRNVCIRDLTACCENGIVIVGEDRNISDIRFWDTRLTLVDCPNRKFFKEKINLKPSNSFRQLPGRGLYWLLAEQVKGLRFYELMLDNKLADKSMRIERRICNCENVHIRQITENADKYKEKSS